MEVDLNYNLIGKRLRAIRKKCGYTQEKLAELADISPQHCSGIESGNAKVSLPALVRLCNALGAAPNELLLDSAPAATKPELLQEVAAVFADATADEMYLMLAQAKSIKEAVRVKNCLQSYKNRTGLIL